MLDEEHLLSEELRKAIHDFSLSGRQIFTQEAFDLLEGVYGLKKDGSRIEPSSLPSLKDESTQKIYRVIIQFIEDEKSAGLSNQEALQKLVKEIAFTHLNRLVAFKMMESCGLIKVSVGKGLESNAFKIYLVETNTADGDLFNHGQRDLAYQHFLLWLSSQIAKEIAVLFDPKNLLSLLFPRPNSLYRFLEMLNSAELENAWKAEETIGWIYQYFNEPELQAAFSAVKDTGVKFEAKDIPSVTQLFTPHWIVKFLVENSLGQMWMQIHPDSKLKNILRYLVPRHNIQKSESIKKTKDITLLDPACGSMHFGLVAFDLFVEMYMEELEKKGNPGWPEQPSVTTELEIPAAIIKNNLFGIDLDLRAVQLSALTLYMKSKKINPKIRIQDHNLACADIRITNGKNLGSFISESNITKPIYEKMLRRLWEKLESINQLGSLLRIESEINYLIKEEREHYEKEGRQPDLFESTQKYSDEAAKDEYWDILGRQLFQALDFFGKHAAEKGENVNFFTTEAKKGIRFLEIISNQYDVVVTNPPYLSRRKMNEELARLLDNEYPEGKSDLFAAFIMRCKELTKGNGWIGMLTMHSFMFISSYEKLRSNLLNTSTIQTMVHLGPGLFATGNPGTLQTTAFVIHKESDKSVRDNSSGTYFRLVHYKDANAKKIAFEKMLIEMKKITEG